MQQRLKFTTTKNQVKKNRAKWTKTRLKIVIYMELFKVRKSFTERGAWMKNFSRSENVK